MLHTDPERLDRLTSTAIAKSLADLKALFEDAEPATQHRIVQALFEQVEVLGPKEVWLYPSAEAEARSWAAAMSADFRIEESKAGRGERDSPSETQRTVPFLLINRTPARERDEESA